MKRCGTCHKEKTYEEFDDTRSTCRVCRNKYYTKDKKHIQVKGIDYEEIPVVESIL